MEAWIDREIAGCTFPDERLGKRLRTVLESLSRKLGSSLPLACQDWAATKAAYRFLDNPRVDEKTIIEGHFEATRSRFAALEGLTLVLHDTTELSYQRKDPGAIGKTHKTFVGRTKQGRPIIRTVCGLLMHSSLAVRLSRRCGRRCRCRRNSQLLRPMAVRRSVFLAASLSMACSPLAAGYGGLTPEA